MEKHKTYDIKFKLKAVVVVKKKCITATAWEFGVKHLSSNNIYLDEGVRMQIVFTFLHCIICINTIEKKFF